MNDLLTSLRLGIVTLVVCCVLYPGALWLFGHAFAPARVDGDLLRDPEGRVIGARRVAQSFLRPEYVWPRPSAVDFDASAAGGSNLSPTDARLTDRALEILARLAVDDRLPADLVAASGSGIDPDVTERGARIQAARVAEARGIEVATVHAAIDRASRHPGGLPVGERVVNVLELNLGLDAMTEDEPLVRR